MTRTQLIEQIKLKRSFLCIGLDTDIEKIPACLMDVEDPVFEFNKRIVEATADLCVAYKPNIAFYESRGVQGWRSLQRTYEILPQNCLSIADAKRGDIGNTADMYAKAFFSKEASGMEFDAITIAPYMGEDSISPFLKYQDKWSIVLALTSNKGSLDFQLLADSGDKKLFEHIIEKVNNWGDENHVMYVVGATRGQYFKEIRQLAPRHFLLVPGVGAQGGSLQEVCEFGMNEECGLLVNATRSVIYASNGEDFAEKAREEAQRLQLEMEHELLKAGVIA
ncbi:orotidine-5'-phosphate decarboxylase [Olivibacter sp. XZL3]|uniref:orotidine-5'-phosphate decarboxylase n=1 Tax=Olivibacter sp. XZL3 TaxID=1735116 RepID=UPI0010660938|nr:orotidine-5'-phosphate decarboxylase [Olivibacter sp. XZL3]